MRVPHDAPRFQDAGWSPYVRAAIDGVLVVGIAAEGAVCGGLLGVLVLVLVGEGLRWAGYRDGLAGVGAVAAAVGSLLAAGLAGWRVIGGGWRGAARTLLVVAGALAAGLGTYHSPLIVERRGHDLLAAAFAGLAAAGFGALALLRRPPPASDLPRDEAVG